MGKEPHRATRYALRHIEYPGVAVTPYPNTEQVHDQGTSKPGALVRAV